MWDQFTTGHLSSAMRLDALKSSHPIQVPIHHAEEVEEVFDAISYCKGGSVVKMIKAVLGMKAFQKGLGNYMKVCFIMLQYLAILIFIYIFCLLTE